MPTQKLTPAFVKTATPAVGLDREVFWDQNQPSFGLMVTSKGHRSFVVQYRSGGKSRRFTMKGLPTLDVARKQARIILGKVAAGEDPVEDGRRRRLADAGKDTFTAVAENYLRREGHKLRTTERRRAVLERLIFPKLGAVPVVDIKRSNVSRLLDEVEDQHGAAMADQVLAFLRRILNWHALRDDNFRSPIVRGMARRTADQRERDRVLNDNELRDVWRAAETFIPPWGQLIRLLLLTATRRDEVADMRWSEVTGDMWTIPADRYKTRVETTLPLSHAAMNVLDELPRIAGCDYAFTTNGRAPISGFSGFKLRLDMACRVTGWRFHDLRRTARSLLSRAGVNPDIAERCLGHTIGGMRGVYDRHRYLEEMRQAFEALAKQIDEIVHPRLVKQPAAND